MSKYLKLTGIIVVLSLTFFGCDREQIKQRLENAGIQRKMSNEDIVMGLKEALTKGIEKGSDQASKVDGYFKNPNIKLQFPSDIKKVEDVIRDMGLGSVVDKFVKTLNTAAEYAASEAKPIFVDAIKSLTIQDAWNILQSENNAATQFLKENTYSELSTKFKPVIQSALEKSKTTKYYNTIITTYNKIPLLENVNPDLDDYATDKAIDGLFNLIADEEEKIREDPFARTTEILKNVFGLID